LLRPELVEGPIALLLHGGHDVAWDAWDLKPTVVGGAFAVVMLYSSALLRDEAPVDWRRLGAFLLGVAAMLLALVSPIDAASHRLLSMHMLQHVLLSTVGPPLVLLGLSPGLLAPLTRWESARRLLRLATNPVVAGTLFMINMWLWHIPVLYETALNDLGVHITMHVAFMATGLLFWWPVVRPLPELARTSEMVLVLYLIATGFPMGLLSLLFFASGSPVYDYYDTAERLWGVSPLIDQQIAGLIMGALGEAAAFVAVTFLFFRFLDREEAREAASAAGPADAA